MKSTTDKIVSKMNKLDEDLKAEMERLSASVDRDVQDAKDSVEKAGNK